MLAATGAAAVAADVPYAIFIDGRPLDAGHNSALNHRGVVFVNVVRAVKAFNGLLTFDRGGVVRVSIGTRMLTFTNGVRTATLDGIPLPLAGAPFRSLGDTYVPLAPVATLARARLTVDRRAHRALLTLGASEGYAAPAPTIATSGDIQPSPAQALTFATSATTDAEGLHARVDIGNTTPKPYTIDFPTSAQIAFVVSKNGAEIWNSTSAEAVPANVPSRLTIDARGSTTVTENWAGFARLGAGRYTLRVRLLTANPIDTSPVSLGIATPGPSTT